MCEALRPGSGPLWAAAVALNDALSEIPRIDRRLQDVAREVGMDAAAWFAIKDAVPSET